MEINPSYFSVLDISHAVFVRPLFNTAGMIYIQKKTERRQNPNWQMYV
jgi:hypothetical protein